MVRIFCRYDASIVGKSFILSIVLAFIVLTCIELSYTKYLIIFRMLLILKKDIVVFNIIIDDFY